MVERTEELKRDIEETRERMSGTLDTIGDRVSPGRVVERRVNRLRESAGKVSHSVMGKPKAAASSAGGTIGGLRSSAGDAASSATGALSGAPDRLQEATQGNPLAIGAAAFALGAVLGSLAPPSQEEVKLAEQVAEPLQRELTDAGQQLAESVKGQVQEGVQETKAAATSAADEVKQHATEAAGEVTDHAKDAKDQVQSQAKSAADDVRS